MIHCFISVRSNSSRLPGKCFIPFGNSETVLEHIINRVKFFDFIPIISTTTEKSDDKIESISKKNNVLCFRGSSKNKLKRWINTANAFNISHFHTIDADDPFFDGIQVKKSINLLKEFEFVFPSALSSSGLGSEGFSIKTSFLSDRVCSLEDSTDTEMIYDHINFSNAATCELDNLNVWNDYSGEKPRLTLDYIEDYISLHTIAVLKGNTISSHDLYSFFKQNPNWIDINIHCNLKWKINQNKNSKTKIHDI